MSEITISSDFNLVIPIEEENTLWVHSMPIPKEVFKKFYLPLSKAFSVLHAEGINMLAGPKISIYLLEEVAEKMGQLENVKAGLINEIRRLTSVCVLDEKGWIVLPLEVAVKQKKISQDSVEEVISAAVFFTLNWHGLPRLIRKTMIQSVAEMHNWSLTSLMPMEWINTLQTSTAVEDSTTPTSSVPH
jgi:hypothetical protein